MYRIVRLRIKGFVIHRGRGEEKVEQGHVAFDLQMLSGKRQKTISSKEALKDVKPIDWGEEVLTGKKKVVVTKDKSGELLDV